MSDLLESRLTKEQRDECARNDAALIASMFPMERARGQQRHLFRVTIGPCENPRLDFCTTARTCEEAVEESMVLAEDGEHISARPTGEKSVRMQPFSVIATRQQLACAELRETIQMQGFIGGLPR